MDKEEFRVKLEEINHLVEQKDYKGAMNVVDSIDWRRVKNVRTLCVVGEIYAANKRYEDSKEIFMLAYHRAPIGKNILYRLVEVSLKMGDISDATEFYQEFREVAPNDNTHYILKYKIMKEKKAPIAEQIKILETYKDKEFTEKWSYELAKLYYQAGNKEKSLEICDEIILWFNEGSYVLKAMDLKMRMGALKGEEKERYEQQFVPKLIKPEEADTIKEKEEKAPEEKERPEIESISTKNEDLNGVESFQDKISKGIRDIFGGKKDSEEEDAVYEEITGVQEEMLRKSSSEKEFEDVPSLEPEGKASAKPKFSDTVRLPKLNIPDSMKNMNPNETQAPKASAPKSVDEMMKEDSGKVSGDNAGDFNMEDTILAAATAQGIEIPRDEEKTAAPKKVKALVKEEAPEEEDFEEPKNSGKAKAPVEKEIPKEEESVEPEASRREKASVEEEIPEEEDFVEPEASRSEKVPVEEEFPEEEEFYDEEEDSDILAEPAFQKEAVPAKKKNPKPAGSSKKRSTVELEEEEFLSEEDLQAAEAEFLNGPSGKDRTVDKEMSEEEFIANMLKESIGDDEDFVINPVKEVMKAKPEEEMEEEPEEPKEPLSEEEELEQFIDSIQPKDNRNPDDIIPRGKKLTDDEKKLFTYFVKVPGMKEQLVNALCDAQMAAADRTSRTGNIIVMGGRETGKTRLIASLIPAICKELNIEASKVAYVFAEQINGKDITKIVSKLASGFLVIENANQLSQETVEVLDKAMEFRTDGLTVIIEDEKIGMRKLIARFPKFAKKFTSMINIPVFTNDELVNFARVYTKENGYRIDDLGMLELYNLISVNQKEDQPMNVGAVKEMLDTAMAKSQGGLLKLNKKKRVDRDGYYVLYKKDFSK